VTRDPSPPWYQGGLRFACTACGDCCTGEPGAIWVNDDEIAALAAHLDMDVEAFARDHVRQLGNRRTLYERFDGDCILFDPETRRCTVYAARPTQCRTWPFWEQNVASEQTWAEICDVCPGSGAGELIPIERIREELAATAEARRKR
jgi:hypothetical protein